MDSMGYVGSMRNSSELVNSSYQYDLWNCKHEKVDAFKLLCLLNQGAKLVFNQVALGVAGAGHQRYFPAG